MKEQEEQGKRERKGTTEQGYLPFWTSLGNREVQPYRNFFFFLRQGFSVALEPFLELALVDQAGLELIEIHLPLPPECWD